MPAQRAGQKCEFIASIMGSFNEKIYSVRPGCWLEIAVLAKKRLPQAVRVVMMLDGRLAQAAYPAFAD